MSTVTDNDLRELKDFINEKFNSLSSDTDKKFYQFKEDINKEFTDIKIGLAKIEEGQNGISKRLDNLEFIARTIGGGVVVALLLGLAKFLFPNFSI